MKTSKLGKITRLTVATFLTMKLLISSIRTQWLDVTFISPVVRSSLDAPPPAPPAEFDLAAGRLNKLPVNWYWKQTDFRPLINADKVVIGNHALRVYAEHTAGDVVAFLVQVKTLAGGHVSAHFSKDKEADNRTYIELQEQPEARKYDIYAFSLKRATAYCALKYKVKTGLVWPLNFATIPPSGGRGNPTHIGGTLVRVGALRLGDFLEVQTAGDNRGANGDFQDTQMLLFDLGPGSCLTKCQTQNQPRYGDNQLSGDLDPLISLPTRAVAGGPNWSNTDNYVLLGRVGAGNGLNSGVETVVDLIRGPLNQDGPLVPFHVNGGIGMGEWSLLYPGRYYLWIYAKTTQPIGDLAINSYGGQYNSPCGFYYGNRGQPNDDAFTLYLDRQRNPFSNPSKITADVLKSRIIPRAALGTDADETADTWNRFVIEVEVYETGNYRLRTEVAPGMTGLVFHPYLQWRRNPDVNEIKVLSHNTLFNADVDSESKYRNSANLFATRGTISASDLSISEPLDQAPFEWDADVIGLQEFIKCTNPTLCCRYFYGTACIQYDDFYYAKAFVNEAETRGSLQWEFVKGRDEDWTWGLGAGPGLGPVFINEKLWPVTNDPASIYFSQADKEGICNGSTLDYAECFLSASSRYVVGETRTYMIPGRVAAKRYGSNPDLPIAVFNMHFDSEVVTARSWFGIDRLISKVKTLMTRNPLAFNREGNTSPLSSENRFIIFGDSNLSAHDCGEHYAMLRKLRENFGYAVDVAMAAAPAEKWYGMHDNGRYVYSTGGVYAPDPFVSVTDWRARFDNPVVWPDPLNSPDFPWWSSTWRGKTNGFSKRGERYDVVWLVGLGWASDDPVRVYTIMSDNHDTRGEFTRDGGCVRMWTGALDSLNHPNWCGSDPSKTYRPNRALCSGTDCYRAALYTDHLPIGARLRVQSR